MAVFERKYELTDEVKEVDGVAVYRIRALRDIGESVKAGDLGGWIESEEVLSQDGACWVGDDAVVLGDGLVRNDALVLGNAKVSGNSLVINNAIVKDSAEIRDSLVADRAVVSGSAVVADDSEIRGSAIITGKAVVDYEASISDFCRVDGSAQVSGEVYLRDHICVTENARVDFSERCAKEISGDYVFRGDKVFSGLCSLDLSDDVDTSESTFSELVLKTKAPAKEKEKAIEPIHVQETTHSRGRSR
jgi:hypothetical protein